MKRKDVGLFWLGFLLAAGVTAWLYWWWRQQREVVPGPLVVAGPTALTKPLQVSGPLQTVGLIETVEKMAAAAREAAGAVQPEQQDSLETIQGIGPTYARRLNEAGIYTFADLAQLTPERAREITGVIRWDPAEWIAEAKRLSEA